VVHAISKYSLCLYLFQFPSFFWIGTLSLTPLFRGNCSLRHLPFKNLFFSAAMLLARDSNSLSLLLFPQQLLGRGNHRSSWNPPLFPDGESLLFPICQNCKTSLIFQTLWNTSTVYFPVYGRQTYNLYVKLQSHAWVFSSMHHE
jgi:hypothetical protein